MNPSIGTFHQPGIPLYGVAGHSAVSHCKTPKNKCIMHAIGVQLKRLQWCGTLYVLHDDTVAW